MCSSVHKSKEYFLICQKWISNIIGVLILKKQDHIETSYLAFKQITKITSGNEKVLTLKLHGHIKQIICNLRKN